MKFSPKKLLPLKKPANQTNMLDTVNNKTGISMVIHGPPGIGKTTGVCHLDNICIMRDKEERSIIPYKEKGFFKNVPVMKPLQSWNDFEDQIDWFCDQNYKTLIIDSLTGLENLMMEEGLERYTVLNKEFTESQFFSFETGSRICSLRMWFKEFIQVLNDKVLEKGKNVIMLAHSEVKLNKNPEGEDFEVYVPKLSKYSWQQTHRWCNYVIFYGYTFTTERKGLKTKAKAMDRTLWLKKQHFAEAKCNDDSIEDECIIPSDAKDTSKTLKELFKL